jgi:hypothetical protein
MNAAEAKAKGKCTKCRKRPARKGGDMCVTCWQKKNAIEQYDPMWGVGYAVYALAFPEMDSAKTSHLKPKELCRPDLVPYIGLAKSMHKRNLKEMNVSHYDKDRPLSKWILSIRPQEPVKIPLQGKLTRRRGLQKEKRWIELYRKAGAPLLNDLTPRERAAKKRMERKALMALKAELKRALK